jgi:predicted transporter
MSSHRLVPLHCEGCDKTSLQPIDPGIAATCPVCGALGSILPGELYSESDVASFERLVALVKAAQLSARHVRHVIAELTKVSAGATSPELALLQAVELIPGLHFLLSALCLDRASGAFDAVKLKRASGMLLVTVSAQLRRIEAENAARAS